MEMTPDQIEKAFETIPETLNRAIESVGVDQAVHEICQKKNMHVDQEGIVISEVWYILLGLSRAEDLVKTLSSRVIVPGLNINELVSELDEKIFKEVKKELIINETAIADSLDDEVIKQEEGVLAKSGVTIDSSTQLPDSSANGLLDRKLILEGIEHPEASQAPTLSQRKLEEPHSMPPVETDHSLTNLSASHDTPQPSKRTDPYREPL